MIHPAQIDAVQSAFSPSQQGKLPNTPSLVFATKLTSLRFRIAIEKAQAILAQYRAATEGGKGAYGFAATKCGKAEMIDAPMILQAQKVLGKAAQYGLV